MDMNVCLIGKHFSVIEPQKLCTLGGFTLPSDSNENLQFPKP